MWEILPAEMAADMSIDQAAKVSPARAVNKALSA
jgi:hypothetical protein